MDTVSNPTPSDGGVAASKLGALPLIAQRGPASSFNTHDTACVFRMRHNKCWSLLYGVYGGGGKIYLYINIGFLNGTFFYQVLLSRILSGLAIYLQNDLNFSGNITLSVHKVVS